MRENNFRQFARATRTSNKPNNMKYIGRKKKKHVFFHSNLFCSSTGHRHRSLHATAIQGNYFHVTLPGSDNIRLQKRQQLRNMLEKSVFALLKLLALTTRLRLANYFGDSLFISSQRNCSQISGAGRRSEPKPSSQWLHPPAPRGHCPSGAKQWDKRITFPTAGSGNLRNGSFIKHIRDSALFAY